MLKYKINDRVIVIAGNNKGKLGTISKVINKRNSVILDGVNLKKKHVKANPNKNINGGIVKIAAPIHMSNIALFNNSIKKKDRIFFKFIKPKKKYRVFKTNKEVVS